MKCFNFAWLMLGLLFLCSGLAAQEFTGKAAEEIIPGAAMVLLEEGNDLPKMIRFRDDARIPVADFAAWEKANMGFGPNIHFGDEISKKDEYGQDHVQRRQFVRNIPVDKSRCVLHIRNGKVYAINYDGIIKSEDNDSSVMSRDSAESMAFDYFSVPEMNWRELYFSQNYTLLNSDEFHTSSEQLNAELVVHQKTGKSAWKISLSSNHFDLHQTLYIDAQSGNEVSRQRDIANCNTGQASVTWMNTFVAIETDRPDELFILHNDCDGKDIRTRNFSGEDFTDLDNQWFSTNLLIVAGQSAHWSMGIAFDYFNNNYGQFGFDGTGSIDSRIVFGQNANFNRANNQFTFGLGSLNIPLDDWTSIEFCGHELTHALLFNSAIENDDIESSAIHEGLADIFGNDAESNFFSSNNDWIYGNGITNFNPRSFINPNSDPIPSPDTYFGNFWLNNINNDHENAGVFRRWMYLVTNGGNGTNDFFNDYYVEGIGNDLALDILYNAITNLRFGTSPNFLQARAATLQAAEDMGFDRCSHVYHQVYEAWRAVGVGAEILPDLTVNNLTSDLGTGNNTSQGSTFNVTFDLTSEFISTSAYIGFALNNFCTGEVSDFFQISSTQGVDCSTTEEITIAVTLPNGIEPGQYTLVVKADPNQLLDEDTESNNHDCIVLNVEDPDPLPDFISLNCGLPSTVQAGETFTTSISVRNIGTAYGDYTRTGLYLSEDQVYNGTTVDPFLATRHFGYLHPGWTRNGNVTITIPADTEPGQYYILYQADTYGWRTESNENNNLLACQVTVTAPPANLPDLVIESVNPGPDFGSPPTVAPNTNLTVSYNLVNDGTNPVASTTTKIYLSSDQVIDQGDDPVATLDSQQPGPHQATFKMTKKFGFWYILIEADNGNVVAESVESNNVNYGFFQVGNGFNGVGLTGGSGTASRGFAEGIASEGDFAISLFPNPATDQINLRYTIQPNDQVRIQLNAITGRRIVNLDLSPNEQTGSWSYSTDELPTGIYQVIVRTKDRLVTKKLVIN